MVHGRQVLLKDIRINVRINKGGAADIPSEQEHWIPDHLILQHQYKTTYQQVSIQLEALWNVDEQKLSGCSLDSWKLNSQEELCRVDCQDIIGNLKLKRHWLALERLHPQYYLTRKLKVHWGDILAPVKQLWKNTSLYPPLLRSWE